MSIASEIERLVGIKQDIKNAIIAKGQSVSDTDAFGTYAEKIAAIDTVASGTADATAAAGDILSGKTAYVKGAKVTGTIATKTASNLTASGKTVTVPAGYYASQVTKDVATATQATPAISVDSAGLITASATQTAGYVAAGTKSATKQLTTQAAKTVTPGTSDQTAVASGVYTTGAVTVKGDANLDGANIVEGKTIFGKAGTAEPASALSEELTAQDTLIADIMTALEGKSAGGGTSLETCTVTFSPQATTWYYIMYSTVSDGELVEGSGMAYGGNSKTFTVAKKTYFIVYPQSGSSSNHAPSVGGSATVNAFFQDVNNTYYVGAVFYVTGDCNVSA